MKVKAYWNNHLRRFSVVALEGEHKGKVIGHEHELFLTDCTFVVQPAGHAKAVATGKRRAHDWVTGEYWAGEPPEWEANRDHPSGTVTYHPVSRPWFFAFDRPDTQATHAAAVRLRVLFRLPSIMARGLTTIDRAPLTPAAAA